MLIISLWSSEMLVAPDQPGFTCYERRGKQLSEAGACISDGANRTACAYEEVVETGNEIAGGEVIDRIGKLSQDMEDWYMISQYPKLRADQSSKDPPTSTIAMPIKEKYIHRGRPNITYALHKDTASQRSACMFDKSDSALKRVGDPP